MEDGYFDQIRIYQRACRVRKKDGIIVVTSTWLEIFPAAPVDLRFFFKLEGDKIAALEIIP